MYYPSVLNICKSYKDKYKTKLGQLSNVVNNNDINGAKLICNDTNNPIARMILKGLNKIEKVIRKRNENAKIKTHVSPYSEHILKS